MIDKMLYGALTAPALAFMLKNSDNSWRVYPRGSLGVGGIPAKPEFPYVQYGEGDGTQVRDVRDTNFTVVTFYDIFAYDQLGSYDRIKQIHELIRQTVLELVGQVQDDGVRCTDISLSGYSRDGVDTVTPQLTKSGSYRVVAAKN